MAVYKGPMLKDLLMWKCCDHCKDRYCPGRIGHYVVCPTKECVLGHQRVGT